MVMGFGNTSCGDWALARSHESTLLLKSSYEGWIEGYFTAFNQWGGADHNITDGENIDGVSAKIDNYCAAHRLSTIADAVQNVLSDLIDRSVNKTLRQAKSILSAAPPAKK
jgi:hypothetical protein